MSRYERWGSRDLTLSNWHRYMLSDDITMIDLDAIEYCRRCRMPLALVEAARDVGQAGKPTIVLERLAQAANVLAVCVLWTPSEQACVCRDSRRVIGCQHGIEAFRIRQVYPQPERFSPWTPAEFAAWLCVLHQSHERAVCRYRKPA